MLPTFPALDANWRQTLRAQTRSVVFCWASWSPPDKALADVLARVAPDYAAQFAFFTADVDEESLIPVFTATAVYTTPKLMLFERDVAVKQNIGFVQEETLRALFDAWLQA